MVFCGGCRVSDAHGAWRCMYLHGGRLRRPGSGGSRWAEGYISVFCAVPCAHRAATSSASDGHGETPASPLLRIINTSRSATPYLWLRLRAAALATAAFIPLLASCSCACSAAPAARRYAFEPPLQGFVFLLPSLTEYYCFSVLLAISVCMLSICILPLIALYLLYYAPAVPILKRERRWHDGGRHGGRRPPAIMQQTYRADLLFIPGCVSLSRISINIGRDINQPGTRLSSSCYLRGRTDGCDVRCHAQGGRFSAASFKKRLSTGCSFAWQNLLSCSSSMGISFNVDVGG